MNDTTQVAQCRCLNLKPSLSIDTNQNAMWVHDAQCGLPPYPADQEDAAEVEQQICKSWADEQREVEAIRKRAATDYRHISDEQYTPMLADIRTLLRALNLVTAFWEGAEKELTEATSHTETGQGRSSQFPEESLVHMVAEHARHFLSEYKDSSVTDGDLFNLFRALLDAGYATPTVKAALTAHRRSAEVTSHAFMLANEAGDKFLLLEDGRSQYVYQYRDDDAEAWAVFSECTVGSIASREVKWRADQILLTTASALPDEKCAECGHDYSARRWHGFCQYRATEDVVRDRVCGCHCDFSRPAQSQKKVTEPNSWQWTHERDAELIARDGWMCEQHPGREWPHDACAGPGQPWIVEGKAAICALKEQR